MPLQNVVSFGSIACTIPVQDSVEPINYFALSTPDSGHTQVLDRWRYLGHDGVNFKKMGLGGRSGSIVGWIEADTIGNLNTAETQLKTKVIDCIPETFTFEDGVSINAILTGYGFPRLWRHGTRKCRDFILTWEEVL